MALRLGRPFTDNAVLQRDTPCPVFGSDQPGTRVAVTIGGQTRATQTGADGNWRVTLAPMPTSREPQTLRIVGTSTVLLTNLLVGDVWLIAGQSNADWPLSASAGGAAAIQCATNSQIRLFQLAEALRTDARPWTAREVAKLNPSQFFTGTWQVCTPATAGAISAVGYFFAQHLQTNLNVPMGLIDCTVGGTTVESWLPAEVIAANPALKAVAEDLLESRMTPRFIRQRLLENLADWDRAGRPAPMPEHPYKPGACWRLGLGQLPPFALKGVLWYQGESDADFPASFDYDLMARWYRQTFGEMVAGWRAAWQQPGLPFYFVQLPRMNRPSWPWFRESQSQCARSITNTAMAVAFEYGETANVHPLNKQPVGERLALIARAWSYGEDIEWSGPVCASNRVEGGSIVLEFDHATSGLVSRDRQPLRLFEIAGTNRQFFTATAVVSNRVLIVSAPQVREPVAVRYAWVPDGNINFYNGAGLPASPFRTDSWPAADGNRQKMR